MTGFDLGLVRNIRLLIKSREEVFGIDTNGLSTFLSETEGGNGECLDSICLERSTWLQKVGEFLEDLVNIIGVPITGYDAGVEDLNGTIHHPGTGCTLWMSSEVLLAHC